MITETFHFFNLPVHDPEIGPMLVFQDVSPIYLKVNFLKWCEIGLAEIDRSRQTEIEAINLVKTEFLGLIDAVYFIATTFKEDITDEDRRNSVHHYIENYYKKNAKKEEILLAPDFCESFFQRISFDSSKSLLWVMMELTSVHCSKHEYHLDPSSILDLFERYSAIVVTGHNWRKINKKYQRLNKRSGSRNKRDITKHFLPIYFPTDGPDIGAMLIFRDVTPSYLKEHFLKWCCIAVAEIEPSRLNEINAIRHLQTEFVQLIDAVYATGAAMISDHSNKALDELLQQYYDSYYKKDIERNAIPLPTSFCQDFFKEITAGSTKALLWLLVHAVTGNKEKYQYEVGQAHILNLFHRFTAVVVVSEDWQENLDKRERAKKKRGTNFTKKKKKRQK